MQIGGEIASCGENALALFAFTLAIELFPPLGKEMKFGLEVHHNLNLLAGFLVERIAHSRILCGRIFSKRNIGCASLFHRLCALYQFFHVETCAGNGQQANRCQHRETTTHVVGNNKTLVAFFVGANACGTFLGVSHRHNHIFGFCFATLCFALFLQQAERERCFGGGSRFADVDDTKLLAFQIFGEFKQIVFANVVTCKEDGGVSLVVHQPGEAVAERFNYCTCAQIRAADASNDNHLTFAAQRVGNNLNVV